MINQEQICSCRPQQLLLYHYDELDTAGRRQVEQHLQSCTACRAELSELQSLLTALPTAAPKLSSAELDRFSARVMEQVQPRRSRFTRPALGWALAGGAALLITLNLPQLLPTSAPLPAKLPVVMTADQDVLLNLELLQTLELLEDFELLQQLEPLG